MCVRVCVCGVCVWCVCVCVCGVRVCAWCVCVCVGGMGDKGAENYIHGLPTNNFTTCFDSLVRLGRRSAQLEQLA